MGARELQEQAAALFLLAEDAFGRGKTQLGEQLTVQQQVQPKDDDKE